MKQEIGAVAMVLLASGSASAQEGFGVACLDADNKIEMIVSFQVLDNEKVAILDGDFENLYSAEWPGSAHVPAWIEGTNFLAVLDGHFSLNILSKSGPLQTLSCIDITKAAATLNSDFGELSLVNKRVSDLEMELVETRREAQRQIADLEGTLVSTVDRAQREISVLEDRLAEATAQAEQYRSELSGAQSERQRLTQRVDTLVEEIRNKRGAREDREQLMERLEEEIEQLNDRNEQLIRNSRMWQDRIAELEEELARASSP